MKYTLTPDTFHNVNVLHSVENRYIAFPMLTDPPMTTALPEMTEIWQQTLNWLPNEQQQSQFQRLYELIVQGNQQFNLTRITEPTEFWEKHLWDSLRGIYPSTFSLLTSSAFSKLTPNPQPLTPPAPSASLDLTPNLQPLTSPIPRIIDIGTGAGFPGVPVAIALPHAQVTLMDSTQKKIAFLATVLNTLGLENAKAIASRAEEVGKNAQYRKSFDIALIRAVAAANVCAEYALPLLKVGGIAILYRGQWTEAEQQTLDAAARQLGGTIEQVNAFVTPLSQGIRHCLYLRKVKPTPAKFPRAVGIPARQPLPLL
jgi:16S rRNA (guanine527-N7)-methyltransferase